MISNNLFKLFAAALVCGILANVLPFYFGWLLVGELFELFSYVLIGAIGWELWITKPWSGSKGGGFRVKNRY